MDKSSQLVTQKRCGLLFLTPSERGRELQVEKKLDAHKGPSVKKTKMEVRRLK